MKTAGVPLRLVVGSYRRKWTGRWDILTCGHSVQAVYGDHPARRRCVDCWKEYWEGQLLLW